MGARMDEQDLLAGRFDANRSHLRSVAYRMLGSLSDADDAVQEAWLRLSRSDTTTVDNLGGWMTTVISRICLDMLRTRKARNEESLEFQLPDPIVSRDDGTNPEHEAILAESVGLALLVVLDTLAPAERLAFVLHDVFAMPFDEIGPIVGRTPTAARQLASRARRRVQGEATVPDTGLARQREVVDAFLAATRDGNFGALVAVLDPDIVLRVDTCALPTGTARLVRGAAAVAGQALTFSAIERIVVPALVNGTAGIVTFVGGQPFAVMSFTVRNGRIAMIDILADPARLQRLGLSSQID